MKLFIAPALSVLCGLTGGITYHLVRNPALRTSIIAVTIVIIYSLWVGEFYLCSIQIGE